MTEPRCNATSKEKEGVWLDSDVLYRVSVMLEQKK